MTSDLGLALNLFSLGLAIEFNYIYPEHVMTVITSI